MYERSLIITSDMNHLNRNFCYLFCSLVTRGHFILSTYNVTRGVKNLTNVSFTYFVQHESEMCNSCHHQKQYSKRLFQITNLFKYIDFSSEISAQYQELVNTDEYE